MVLLVWYERIRLQEDSRTYGINKEEAELVSEVCPNLEAVPTEVGWDNWPAAAGVLLWVPLFLFQAL